MVILCYPVLRKTTTALVMLTCVLQLFLLLYSAPASQCLGTPNQVLMEIVLVVNPSDILLNSQLLCVTMWMQPLQGPVQVVIPYSPIRSRRNWSSYSLRQVLVSMHRRDIRRSRFQLACWYSQVAVASEPNYDIMHTHRHMSSHLQMSLWIFLQILRHIYYSMQLRVCQ